MNKTIEYNDKFNQIDSIYLTASEMNIFFTICYKFKNIKNDKISITFKELRHRINYNQESYYHLVGNLESTLDKMMKINHKLPGSNIIMSSNLFDDYIVYVKEHYFEIQVSDAFSELLNNLNENFTQLYLEEFVSLKTVYSKKLYRLLKQFQDSSYVRMDMETFRKYMDIPKSYRMSQINSRVLNPSIKETSKFFPKLRVKKIRGMHNKVVSIEFFYNNKV